MFQCGRNLLGGSPNSDRVQEVSSPRDCDSGDQGYYRHYKKRLDQRKCCSPSMLRWTTIHTLTRSLHSNIIGAMRSIWLERLSFPSIKTCLEKECA